MLAVAAERAVPEEVADADAVADAVLASLDEATEFDAIDETLVAVGDAVADAESTDDDEAE